MFIFNISLMNNFTVDQLAKSETIDPISLNRFYKLKYTFMEIKYIEPRIFQKQICNYLGFPDSTIKRYRDDIIMKSP